MTDTDSLMYEIHTEDFFEVIREGIKEKFDTPTLRIQNFRDLTKKSLGCLRTRLVGRSYLNLLLDFAPNHMSSICTVN